MPRTPLDPEIDSGLRTMPPDEAIATALKLSASLAAGVALLRRCNKPDAPRVLRHLGWA